MANKIEKDIFSGKVCPYCARDSQFLDSSIIYRRSYGMIYICKPCESWVGVHKGTEQSLGRLANSELREANKEAHFYFDKLWQEKIKRGAKKIIARNIAYAWLSEQLNTKREETHIGWFDLDTCKKVVDICKPIVEKLKL